MTTEIEKSAGLFAEKFKLQNEVLQKFHKTILQMDLLGIDAEKYETKDLFMLILSAIEKGVDLIRKDAYIVDLQITEKTKNEKGQIVERRKIKPTIWLNINFEKQQILKNPNVAKIATLKLDQDIEVSYDFQSLEFVFEKKGKIVSDIPRYAAIILMKDGIRHVNVMSEDEILARLPEKFTDSQKAKYTGVFATDHCTKMVLRNLLKNVYISDQTTELYALENINYAIQDVEHEDVHEYIEIPSQFKEEIKEEIKEKIKEKTKEKIEKKMDLSDFM